MGTLGLGDQCTHLGVRLTLGQHAKAWSGDLETEQGGPMFITKPGSTITVEAGNQWPGLEGSLTNASTSSPNLG